MDNVSSTSYLANYSHSSVASSTAVTAKVNEEKQVKESTQSVKGESGVKVQVSEQGQAQLREEKRRLGQEISSQLRSSSNKSEETDEASQDPYDRIIKQLKEQIREVKDQLAKLESDKSEAAQRQKEALTAQLMELNSQLISAYEEKLAASKGA